MVSKNNLKWKQQRDAQRVPHYGLRKLSVGVASVLLSTTLYMGATASADTVSEPSGEPAVTQPTSAGTGSSTSDTAATAQPKSTADQPANTVTGASTDNTTADAKPVQTANVATTQPAANQPASSATSGVQPATNSNPPTNDVNTASAPADLPKQPANTASGSNDSAAQLTERSVDGTRNSDITTVNSTFEWTIHYTDEAGKTLVPDSVISHEYTRTDTGDQMGNWSYVPDSAKVTGTPNAGWHIDNPDIKFDQTIGGNVFDTSNWQAAAVSVDGYTPKYGIDAITDELPKNPESLHATSPTGSRKGEFTFVYTKQPTKVTINYVDDDQGEKVVGTGTVSGKTGSEVTITPSVPTGYMLTPGKDVPSMYTVTAGDNQVVTIHVQKQFVDTSATDPQAKQTRTVTLHYVYGAGDKQGQKAFDDAVLNVYYRRTATLDRATNQTKYGDWLWDQSQGDPSTPGYHVVSGKWTNLPQHWDGVTADVPSIKGYRAELGQNDPANTNHVPANTWVYPTWNGTASSTGDTLDGYESKAYQTSAHLYEVQPEHTIKYMPNKTTLTVKFVDDDNKGSVVGSQHWDGTTGQHIDLTLTPPDNYVLSPGWVNPTNYDFDGVNNAWYNVHVKHATRDVTDQQPKDQVTKIVVLTRNHLYGDGPHKGEKFGEPDIFDLGLKRTATKDLVTGNVTFGDWQPDQANSKSVQGSLHVNSDGGVDGTMRSYTNNYSYLGQGTHADFIADDGTTVKAGDYYYGWTFDEAQRYPVCNWYYGRDQIIIPVYYIDADTGERVGQKASWTGDDDGGALTGPDYLDGNTVTIDQSKLTSLPILTGYQLLPGQTLPTSYKIDTFAGVTPIIVQVVKDRSINVKFVDDQHFRQQVGQATTVIGRDGDTVDLKLTVPDKYQLADGQQLPTAYTFTKGSGDLVIHLTHKVVQREAAIDVQLGSYTLVRIRDDRDGIIDVVPQTKWTPQLADKFKNIKPADVFNDILSPVEVGTLTGHVNYDLVDEEVTSFGDGWTSLNLGGQTHQMPDGDDVVNGVVLEYNSGTSEKFRDGFLQLYPNVDPDYVNHPWHSYLSANALNNLHGPGYDSIMDVGLQSGFTGDEPNALAKATGDRDATLVEISNKPIDLSLLQSTDFETSSFSEQNGQLRAKAVLPVIGVYVPYVEKTTTRAINVMTPDGKTTTVKQTATLAKQVDFSKNAHPAWTIGEWTSYDVPTIPGYTASQSNVAKEAVTGETKDQTVNINYTANPQTTRINYVDGNGKVVHTTTVNGKTNQTVDVPSEVPTGWKLVDGQTVPSTITFGANGHADTSVKIEHRRVTVTPDKPQTNGTKLPDNPAQSFYGVEASDLNKTATRTIKVTTPDGQTKTVTQTAKLTRTADVDEVTGEVTYGNWTTGQWDAYKVPTVDGYTPSYETVEAATVDESTLNKNVTITYTQTTHPIVETATKTLTEHFIYGGSDRQGKVAAPDSQIKLFFKRTNQVATDGAIKSYGQWELDPSQGTNGYQIVSGKWQIPASGNYDVLRAVAELPDGRKLSVNENQEYHYSSSLAWFNPELSAVDYFEDPDFYDVRAEHTTYVYPVTKYVSLRDRDPKHIGSPYIDSVLLTGYADESRDFTWDDIVAAGKREKMDLTNYELVPGQSQTVHVDFEPQSPDLIPINLQHKHREVQTVDHVKVRLAPALLSLLHDPVPDMLLTLNSQITKDGFSYKNATYHEATVDVPVTLTYDAVTQWILTAKVTPTTFNIQESRYSDDELNGHDYGITLTNYGTAEIFDAGPDWRKVLAKPFNGLREQLAKLLGVTDDQTLDDVINKSTLKTAYFTYPKRDYTTNTDQAVTKNQIVLDGDNLSFPDFSDFKGDEPLNHAPRLYDENKPLTDTIGSFQILDWHFPKPVTRTINMHLPSGKVETTTQVADAGKTVSFNADHGVLALELVLVHDTLKWANYEVPTQTGYTSSQTTVEAQSVDDQTVDQTVDIYYTANSQTTTVKYVDDKGDVVHTTTVTGKTGETVKVPNEVPAGWTITKGQVPSELTFGADGHEPIEVTVVHQHVTVTPDHPQTNGTKLPNNPAKTFNGVEENDLNKTIARTIKVATPDGQTKTVTQTAKLTRTASVDEVTGEVTYGDWTTGEWTAYAVPSVAGYTPSQTKVDKETVTAASKDTITTITYTPNQHQISVEYVDDDTHGKIVKTDQVPGKTDQTITVAPSAPANYDLVDNGNRIYTVTSGDGQTVQIHVKHHQVTTSESKTVTRTINVHTPHDGAKTVKQTADLNRDVTTDQVTGEKTYGDWTTGQWKAYAPEAIPGYTPSTNEVPIANVDGSSTDQTVDVTYAANAQHVNIVYVDDAKGGVVVKTDQVVGKTDETVKVTPNVPTGYKVVGEVPGSYTMTADGHQTITVHLVHQMKTASESKTATRTINVNTPHDGTTVFKQTVDLSRDVTTDQVTGDKTYGDWSTTEWTHYDVPAVAGYTPSIKQVAQQVVNGTTKDQTIDVTYTANAQATHVNYVDGDGKIVHTTTVTGKTDQTVKVPNETPAGWKVVGESVPTELTFGPDGHADVAVTVDHQRVTVTPDDPKTPADKLPNNPGKTYPDGVGYNDLNRTVTRTIKVVTPDGQTKTVTQKVQLTRSADVDEVTGKVTYGDWTTGEWTRYEVPAVPGYTPSQSDVPAVNVTDTTKDQMLTLTYTANDQTTHVNYVDGNGKTVHTTTVTGKTDQTVKVPNEVPTGWTITKGQVPAEITFGPDGHADVTVTVGHQHVTVTPDQPKTPSDKLPNNPGKTYPAGVGHDDLNKPITRTIKVTTPDGKTQTTTQKVQLTRTANVDEVTGEVTYGKWTTGEWANYNVPTVPGYTASQSDVPATKVTDSTKDQTVTVTYTANAQTTTINYVDGDGKVVHTTTVNGHTDQTVKVPNETPAGWTITDGQVPTEITFGPNGHDRVTVTVTVDHKHVAVTPDKPQTDGTKLPDNPSQTFHGVGHDDLNKTIVRTIEVTAPTGKTDTIKQTVKLTRSADVDEATGEVTYGKWTTGSWSSYNVPTVAGYTPSQAVVAEVAVNADTTDQTVKISYTANDQATHINYVDENGEVVHTTTIKGHTDQTVKVPNETPAGWTVTGGQVPSEVTFGADGYTDVKITVDHKTVTVAPDDPKTDGTKLPDNPALTFQGVEHDDLNRTVTRTIKVTTPDGKTQTVAQKVQLTRSADVDEATGEVTYGNWSTGAWEAYQVPTVPGYTASQATVPAIKVTAETDDQTVAVTYMANEQTTHINYVDENGNVVHTTTVTGQTDQTVKVPNEVPTGWTITTGEVPSEVTFGADGHDNVTVTVDHKTITVAPDHPQTDGTKLPDNPALTFHGVGEDDLNRTVTRTFTLNVPGRDPQVVTQTAKLTRTATVDEVTGDVTYGDWTTGHWDAYEVPTVDGYTTDQKMVPAVDVTGDTTSQEVTIDYTAVPAEPETPAKPETPAEPETPAKPETPATPSKHQAGATQAPAAKAKAPVQTPAVKAKANTQAQAQQAPQAQTLPQTGEKQNTLAPIGAALLGMLSGFGLFAKKRKKDDGEKL